jgi:3-oxoacyl-[acyl-carrier-protein] synthase-3
MIKRDQSPSLEEKNYIEMNGRGIFNFALSEIPNDIEHYLSINETKIEEIDYFVFHQASKFMLDALSKKMKLDKTKVLMSIDLFGNTISSTIPIALKNFFKAQAEVHPLKKILLSGFGVGLSWASTILTFQGDFNNG